MEIADTAIARMKTSAWLRPTQAAIAIAKVHQGLARLATGTLGAVVEGSLSFAAHLVEEFPRSLVVRALNVAIIY